MHTVPARSARHVIALAALRVDVRRLGEIARLDLAVLDDPDARIPMAELVGLYEHAADLTADRCFGLHVGERVDLRAYGTLGYIVLNSATLGDAVAATARYLPTYTDGASFSVEEDTRALALRWHYADPGLDELVHDTEMTLATIATVARRLTGRRCVGEVHLRRSPPRDLTEHERLFGARVHFRMPTNQLVFRRGTLDTPIRDADPELRRLLERQVEAAGLLAPATATWIETTRDALRTALGRSSIRLPAIARRVGIAPRTLQRELAAHGTTFAALLGEVRRERAERELADPMLTIAEIAARLGYASPGELHRAFRRWTGVGPRAFRARR